MPRAVSEIESDIAAAKAANEKPMGAKMRALRAELKAATAPPQEPTGHDPAFAAPPVIAETCGALPPNGSGMAPDLDRDWSKPIDWRAPLKPSAGFQPEEAFIDSALAHITVALDFKGGSMSGVVEKLYERLDAAVKVRRLIIEIVDEVGIGKPWPQFVKLNRNPGTGAKLPPPAPKAPPPPPTVQVPSAFPPNHPGMPPAGGPPSVPPGFPMVEQASVMGQGIANMIAAQVGQRPEPTRAPQPAGV